MPILLFDGPERAHLLPFTYVRPVAHLLLGIDRLIDKWEAAMGEECSVYAESYLQNKFPPVFGELNRFVNSSFLPSLPLKDQILSLKENQCLFIDDHPIALVTKKRTLPEDYTVFERIEFREKILHITHVADLFLHNADVLEEDFVRLTQGRHSAPLSSTNRVINPDRIFIEEGAVVEHAILNATEGPIYIGKNAEVMEGSMLRGGIALGEQAVVKMGAKIYGGTTLGPFCKVGGELSNVVMLGYSNKGHDGFLGNAVIGEWCNIGAATDASNLKNSYAKLRVWNYETENFAKTELQFCGLLMGDFSRCSIHTMFNTATVVGVCSNLFGSGFPRTFLPSFSYGGAQKLTTFQFEKAMNSNMAMMDRRGKTLTDEDRKILSHIYELSSKWRKDS